MRVSVRAASKGGTLLATFGFNFLWSESVLFLRALDSDGPGGLYDGHQHLCVLHGPRLHRDLWHKLNDIGAVVDCRHDHGGRCLGRSSGDDERLLDHLLEGSDPLLLQVQSLLVEGSVGDGSLLRGERRLLVDGSRLVLDAWRRASLG